MNLVILTGRLTKNIDLKYTKNGKPKVQFDLAVESNFKDKNTNKYATTFIPCVSYNHQAEFMNKYLEKGQLIEINGYVNSNRNNGEFFTNIVIRNIKGLEIPRSKRNSVIEQSNDRFTNNDFQTHNNNFNANEYNEHTPYSYMESFNPSTEDELPF